MRWSLVGKRNSRLLFIKQQLMMNYMIRKWKNTQYLYTHVLKHISDQPKSSTRKCFSVAPSSSSKYNHHTLNVACYVIHDPNFLKIIQLSVWHRTGPFDQSHILIRFIRNFHLHQGKEDCKNMDRLFMCCFPIWISFQEGPNQKSKNDHPSYYSEKSKKGIGTCLHPVHDV